VFDLLTVEEDVGYYTEGATRRGKLILNSFNPRLVRADDIICTYFLKT
jgi:hypothetical protein